MRRRRRPQRRRMAKPRPFRRSAASAKEKAEKILESYKKAITREIEYIVREMATTDRGFLDMYLEYIGGDYPDMSYGEEMRVAKELAELLGASLRVTLYSVR